MGMDFLLHTSCVIFYMDPFCFLFFCLLSFLCFISIFPSHFITFLFFSICIQYVPYPPPNCSFFPTDKIINCIVFGGEDIINWFYNNNISYRSILFHYKSSTLLKKKGSIFFLVFLSFSLIVFVCQCKCRWRGSGWIKQKEKKTFNGLQSAEDLNLKTSLNFGILEF